MSTTEFVLRGKSNTGSLSRCAFVGVLFMLSAEITAQLPQQSFFIKIQEAAAIRAFQLSPDFDRVTEMKMLRANFPDLAPALDPQIKAIYEKYITAYILNGNNNRYGTPLQPPTGEQMINFSDFPVTKISWEKKNQPKPFAPMTLKDQLQHIADALKGAHDKEPVAVDYWKTADFTQREKPYYNALNYLKDQLTGKRPLSFADACYAIESAEDNPMLSKKEFQDEIAKAVNFIKRWMLENKLDQNSNLAIHYAIQKFFADTLEIGKKVIEFPNVKPAKHLPFYYDYEDYKAEKDYRSAHVTKGFATGNGQCQVLPLMYACIAEVLGATFYISQAPFHTFIKYPDERNRIHNYEVTSNWQISDQWYKDNNFITSLAEKNQIYLNRMDRQQIVAHNLILLADLFKKHNGIGDGRFMNECIDFAMEYFPNKEANIYGWLLRYHLTAVELNRLLAKKGIKVAEDAEKLPEAQQLHKKMRDILAKIESLGYTEESPEVFEEMIEEVRQRRQLPHHVDNLKRRNLFITSKTE